MVIDQLDNISDSKSTRFILEVITEAQYLDFVEVVVISRRKESHEKHLIEKLTNVGFEELRCHIIDEPKALMLLARLGITNPSEDLIDLSQNLLNLSIIGEIKRLNPNMDFSSFNDEVTLWGHYRDTIIKKEEEAKTLREAKALIAEAIKLATAGLNSKNRSFTIDYPPTPKQSRLISWGIINCRDLSCSFRHEKLQDFLYAWHATQRRFMPSDVIAEISPHKTRNIFTWMAQIYSNSSTELHEQFLREVFNV